MSLPSVAICIPMYNQAKFLEEAVISACRQNYDNLQVWVSDDASTDDTPGIMAGLCRQFSHVRYHRQPQNLGISANNNWLLSQPGTEFIVRLDSDDLLDSGYVAELVRLMTKHPTAGYAHCAVREINPAGQTRRIRRLGRRDEYQHPEESLQMSVAGYRVAANICMFRADVLRLLGYYRTEVEYAQDWDLAVRIADSGWGNAYCADALASYRVWEDASGSRFKRKNTEVEDIVKIFEQSLGPAFAKRGWASEPLQQARRTSAVAHSMALSFASMTAPEKERLKSTLRSLGESGDLERRFIMYRLGLGPLLRWQSRTKLMARDLVKSAVVRLGLAV